MNKPFRIVVLGYGKPTLTQHCLESLRNAGYGSEELLLVDNGSPARAYDPIRRKHPELPILRLEKNHGYAGGWNAGVGKAFEEKIDGVFFLSNDCEMGPGVVETCAGFAQEKGADLVAPLVRRQAHSEHIDSFGAYFDRDSRQLGHYRDPNLPPYLEADDYLPGSAFWIGRKAWDLTGGMDEDYFCYWEDVDFSFRARRAGLRLARCKEATVIHRGRQTTGKSALYTTYYFRRNQIRFCRKHLSPDALKEALIQLSGELDGLERHCREREDSRRLAYLELLREALRAPQQR